MRRDAGLTLIELVIAMALFALVAVMSLQVLNGTLRVRDRYSETARQSGELSLALTLLRRDLSNALPLPFADPSGLQFSSLDIRPPGPVLGLSVGGQPGLGEVGDTAIRRVEWWVDPGERTLMRRVWPTIMPANPGQAGPSVVILRGVNGLDLRLYSDGLGWERWNELPETQLRTDLPDAIEVTLQTALYGAIPLIETYR